nr:transposase domain-containing protein [Enhydrobacter aerosaccus]
MAKLNDVDPQAWLAGVFACIAPHPQSQPLRIAGLGVEEASYASVEGRGSLR